jgi:hypothetical protein
MDENTMNAAMDHVIQSIDQGGDPTDSLVKAAFDLNLTPGVTKLAGYAYNQGRQKAQMGSNTGLDKFAGFRPIDVAEAVNRV